MALNDPLKVRLKMVRFSHPHVFKPKGFGKKNEGDPKFSITGIIDPDSKSGSMNMDAMDAAIELAAKEKWPKDWAKILKKLKKDNRVCLREGDDDKEETDGMFVVAASNEKAPLTLDENGDDITAADDVIYAGCYGDIIVRVWAQDNDYGQRVNASLEGVKYRKDGDPLSSVSRASREDFDDDDEDDRGSSRGRSSRGRSRGRDDEDRDEDRDEDSGRSSRGRSSRDRDEDRDEDRGRSSRGRARDRDEDRDDEDRGRSSRGRGRDRDEDDEPKSRGRSSRDRDEGDEPKSRSRGRSRSREDEDY